MGGTGDVGAVAPVDDPAVASAPPSAAVDPRLVGRAHHLAALEDAFTASRSQAVTMLVHGPSGMGRSALLRRFLDDLTKPETHGALLFEGRSHACARGPYDALAPLVGVLADHLAALPSADVEALLPPDVSALARLFPVLRRSPQVDAAPAVADAPDPREVRRRASIALRALLGRVAARAPLVLALDDVHLGDAESSSLLFELVAPPDAPPLLLLVAYQTQGAASIPLVTALLQRMARGDPAGDVRELLVGPLAPREARALARALLPGERADEGDAAAVIDRLSGGSPFWVRALVRHGHHAGGAPGEVLASCLDALPAPARVLLEVIAAAGRPTPIAVVSRAAAVDDAPAALALLLDEELVLAGEAREVEPSQALVREAVLARAAPDALAEHHRRLARALAESDDAEPEVLLFHLEAAGAAAGARPHAEAAARRAAEALAWGRAAALYGRAARLASGAPDARALHVAEGDALARRGLGAEAGHAYLEACAGAPPDEAIDLHRRALEALLCAGDLGGGVAVARALLPAVGLSWPASSSRAAASLLYRRARLSLRGLDFEERPVATSPAEAVTRVRADVCGAVGDGLDAVDVVRSADFQARHLLFALDAGDPDRIALALASAGVAAAMEGRPGGRERAARLIEQASAVAERAERPLALAWAAAARAGATFHRHRFVDAAAQAERAVELLRGTCAGVARELGVLVGRWLLPALHLLGHLDELVFRLPAWLDELAAHGAHAAVSALRVGAVPRLLLARDQPSEARREAEAAAAELLARGGPAPRWRVAVAHASAALYQGDGAAAHQALSAGWPELEGSNLLRLESVRVEALHLRASSTVAASGSGMDSDGPRLLAHAERDARALRREASPLTDALAGGVLAAVALARGQDGKAMQSFADAEAAFAALEMALHEAAMRRRRGEILMGEDGRTLCMEADGAMWARGVLHPERLAAMLAPVAGGWVR